MELKYKRETYEIIGCAMEVHRELGCGFLEAVYQEALAIELNQSGIPFVQEKTLQISYKEITLHKTYSPDFVCFDKIIVELKAVSEITNVHLSQVFNYLKASGLEVGLLLNFGSESLEYRRIIK